MIKKYEWDTLKASQYFRILQNGDSKKPEDLVWALTGKSKNEMTLKEIDDLRVGDLDPKMDPVVSKIFMVDGVLYGLQDTEDLSFGLFADIMDLGKDFVKFLPIIMSYMYRPVTSMTWWSKMKLKVIARYGKYLNNTWGLKWIFKSFLNLNYTIEKYNPEKCEARVDLIGKAPASSAHFLVTFFLILSRQLQKGSLKSLVSQMEEAKKALRETQSQLT